MVHSTQQQNSSYRKKNQKHRNGKKRIRTQCHWGSYCTTLSSPLVLVLGTAPAVATFNRKQGHALETAIWQSWVWFTKIGLSDRFGYVGGLRMRDGGRKIELNPPDFCKITDSLPPG